MALFGGARDVSMFRGIIKYHKNFFDLWIELIPVARPPLVDENLKELSKLDILTGSLFETIMVLLIINNLS